MEVSGKRDTSRPSHTPNRQEPLPCEFAGPARRLSGMSGGATILIAEDDADVLRARRASLLAPHAAARGDRSRQSTDWIKSLGSAPFDVVLLDMNFVSGERSGGDGLNALARTQAFDPCLAVVLMTCVWGRRTSPWRHSSEAPRTSSSRPWRNDKLIAAVAAAANITPPPRREKENAASGRCGKERNRTRSSSRAMRVTSHWLPQNSALSRPALYRRIGRKHGL